MFRKILIATDGSDHAGKAVEFGADIAAKYGAEVLLAHVLPSGVTAGESRHIGEPDYFARQHGRTFLPRVAAGAELGAVAYSHPDTAEEARSCRVLEAAGKKILDSAESTVRAKGVEGVRKHLLDGKPAEQILGLIDTEKPDLLVCGSRGLSDFRRLLVGSVSHKLSHLAPVTCVMVR